MDNKILVKLIVVSMDKDIDCFIPANEKIYNIKKIFLKYIYDTNKIDKELEDNYLLINARNGQIYNNNQRIIETDIRNSTELILMKQQ